MRFLELCSVPVIAAPMAGGPSTPRLVVEAARAGSLGFLPAGYRTVEQLAADMAAVRTNTEVFGVNLFVPERAHVDRIEVLAYRELIAPMAERVGIELGAPRWDDDDSWQAKVDLLSASSVPWVSFTFGLPDIDTVSRLRRSGTRLLMTVTSTEEALLAAELAPDGLIVQSADAGGHRGTFDQHRAPGLEPLPDLVSGVRAVTGLPVIAAGGLVTPQQVAVVLQAGAEAAQVGTALLLADEAGTRPTHRRAIADPASGTAPMRAFTGRVARGISNAFSRRYDRAAPAGYPAIHHITAPLRRWAADHDDRDHLHLWAGTGHRNARPGKVQDLLAALVP
jgi:NAD(P)H-dependent flavin oxidoreductase YrpB (nitropropane dioxygenase family)